MTGHGGGCLFLWWPIFLPAAHTGESRYPVQTICASYARSLLTGFRVGARNERNIGVFTGFRVGARNALKDKSGWKERARDERDLEVVHSIPVFTGMSGVWEIYIHLPLHPLPLPTRGRGKERRGSFIFSELV